MVDGMSVKDFWNAKVELVTFERGLGTYRGGFDELSCRMAQKIANLEARGIPLDGQGGSVRTANPNILQNEMIEIEKARAEILRKKYATANDEPELSDDEDFDLDDFNLKIDGIDYASMEGVDDIEISDDEDFSSNEISDDGEVDDDLGNS